MNHKKKIKAAVIDMNKGTTNQGLRGILDILSRFREENGTDLSFEVFDVRSKNEIPGLGYDIYISSGGPGSPFDGENESWENAFFALLDEIETYNHTHTFKKYVFFICHSFQLACRKYGFGKVTKRKSNAFGIFPVSLTRQGEKDLLFKGLPNPFYVVDSRDWQVVHTDETDSPAISPVLAIEKERPHINLERCIMSVRFSKEFAGTQFHPEADPAGMKLYLLEEEKKIAIITAQGEEKYTGMLQSLEDPGRIMLTQRVILPNFLKAAIQSYKEAGDDR